ncbi:tropomodulin 2 (neuronal) [Seminavis robusta]|uniref:Tropomodulin 2 (Neuronal) n=1 Tax=Seminavis robusta TaxID=568900 RepID=A0A9N8DEN6_9STRA|nr:tropomodulin 2 (neuronal) [Seminavis robusta]|eukprot:Sro104_g052970.1 tropomodulin 2 (neuronal) (1109) ;mRNA; f:89725-93144
MGKLKHAWPDKGGGDSGSTPSTPAKSPARPGGGVGKLNKTGSPFGNKSTPSTGSSSGSSTPAAKKWSPPSSSASRSRSPGPSAVKSKWNPPSSAEKARSISPAPAKVKGVKIKAGAFTAKGEEDRGVSEAFIAGELIVKDGEVSIEEVITNLKKEPCFLEKLVLVNVKGIDDKFVSVLAKNLKDIRHLDISNNSEISESPLMELVTQALEFSRVETIKLKGTAKISKPNCDKISKLLQNCHVIDDLEADFAEKPAKFDSAIERNRKVNGYAERIKKANSTMDMITRRLSVRDNDLVTTMIKAEENDPSVKEIKIFQDPRFAHIQNTLVVGFAEGLRSNLNLKILIMKGLDLGNIFLSGLASSIEWNFTLEVVDLSNNAFTSDGMSEFCQGMALNESIQKVDLRHQHSPVFSHSEEIVVNALDKNHHVKEFHVEFKTPEMGKKVEVIIERNKKEDKTIDYDKKLIEFLKQEADTVEELAEQRKQEAKPLDIPDDDWTYYYELEQLANQYKCRLIKDGGDNAESGDEAEPTERQTMRKNLNSKRRPSRSLSDAGGMSKSVNITATRFTGDGAFLTDEFITQFLVDNAEDKSVTFDFSCQFKMFKRFPVESPDRRHIVTKFADTILDHPRSKEITHINMSNCFLGNDWLVYFCEKCEKDSKYLPKLHLFNLETNFISESGVVALAKCIGKQGVWKYLQAIKLENQKFLLSSKAENELAKALYVNRGIITVNLRVRNIHERTRIEKYVYRNTDLLRQARRRHKIKTGTLKERKRNKMEQYFDKIAADDPSITEVELVGDQIFIALNKTEKVKAAKAFATNKHVTKVKMTLLKLDDEFGVELGKSLESNSTIEHLILETNNFAGDAIKAIVGCLAKNNTIVELQLRHQNKNMASSDESQIAQLMGDNKSCIKFGVDIRHMQAKNDVEKKIRQNQDLARKNRRKAPARTRSSEDQIKSVATQKILERVIKGDKEITEVVLNGDREFVKMEAVRKKEFYDGMKTNKVVKTLTLNDLQLDNEFGDVLIAILKTNTTLTSISLDRNFFTSLGIYTIVDAVIKSKNVKKLSIMKPRAKISNDESERLLEAMEKECHLQELKIEFRDEAHKERLAKVLK